MVRTKPDDDHDRKLLADVNSHGWHLVMVTDVPDVPEYVFSVGIYHTLGLPEVCIFGLSNTDLMGGILNGIGDLMKSGQVFEDWHESNEVLDGFSCFFRRVDRQHYREFFGYARWFYEGDEFPLLQCVWPDPSNCFPWDSNFDAQLVAAQPVLAEASAWPFLEGKNLGVFTTSRVVDEGYPVLLVTHDQDGDWQFLCNTTNDTDDARVVSLQSIVESHPSVAELADLPMGWQAVRDGPDEPWRRSENA